MASKDSSEVVLDGVEPRGARGEALRLSRLQRSGFNLDIDDDDTDDVLQESISETVNFKKGEAETIKKVLHEMDMISLKKSSGGLSAVNFTLGVLNCFFIVYIIGTYPQHLWLVYFIESFYMIPRKFYTMWNNKPLNQALYYLDFCWMMNFMGIFFLALLILSEGAHFNIGEETRQDAFKSSLGVSCGVLLSANVALPFVAALFHDVNTMTGLFIHLMPPMVVYTFKWHTESIVNAWPNVFHFSYIDNLVYYDGMNGIAGCATVLYFTWWISYTSFMLLIGVNLPKKYNNGNESRPKWDTVFHSTMRDGACIVIGKLRGRSKAESLSLMETNMFDLPDFFLYMTAHMIAALGAIYTIGYGCFLNKWFHLSMLGEPEFNYRSW